MTQFDSDPLANLPRRQCISLKSDGSRCQLPPLKGNVVCHQHFDEKSTIQQKAAVRLLDMVEPALQVLMYEMQNAEKSADRQKAANSLLDRAGIARKVETVDSSAAKMVVLERISALREQPSSLDEHSEPLHIAPTIEGETVQQPSDDGHDRKPRDVDQQRHDIAERIRQAAAERLASERNEG